MNYNIRKLVRAVICYVIRNGIIRYLPNFVSNYLGKKGYTSIINRSTSVNFVGTLYKTESRIHVNGSYAVERLAASNVIDPLDPFIGIGQLELKGKTVIDIGANVGTLSISSKALGAEKVYSIEPGPLFERLCANIKLNGLCDHIKPIRLGIASKVGTLFWAEDKNNPGNAHLINSIDQIDYGKITTQFDSDDILKVKVIPLDVLVEEHAIKNIGLIKIDVEGMEWEVLSSGKNMLESERPYVVAETHRVASDMMKYDCMTPMFQYFYSNDYLTFSLNEEGKLIEFIYPNFGGDTFFIPKEKLEILLPR